MVAGIDVSSWQGTVSWPPVAAAGYRFAYIKATEGTGYVSPTLGAQLSGARSAGLVTGLYHYARPGNAPEAEARHFAAQLKAHNAWQAGNLPPCLDIEEPAGNARDWVARFISALRNEIGRRDVMVYASTSYFAGPLSGEPWADDDVTLWVAHYGPPAGSPGYRSARTVMHQHSSTGRVPGVSGNCDLNECWVDLGALAGGELPTPGPAPAPGGTYTVQPGDTLSGIGARFGVDWHEIARVNGLANPDLIHPGQVLAIPTGGGGGAPAPRTYTVQPGDSLSAIGERFGVGWPELAAVNGIANPDLIFPGQVLRIP